MAELLGEYIAGSPRQCFAVIPLLLQYSKSVPPGLEAISIIIQLPFIVLIRSGVIVTAGAVLNIKSYLLKSPVAIPYPLAEAFAISADSIVSTLTCALRLYNLSASTVPHLP